MLVTQKQYPEVDRKTHEKLSDFFRLTFQTKNGPKTKLLITMAPCVLPELDNFTQLEYEMDAKPAKVEKGLYWYKTDPKDEDSPWTRVDDTAPVFFEDITNLYYEKVRPRMYPKIYETDEKGEVVLKNGKPVVLEDPDPLKDQPRPTIATGMEAEIERLKRELQQKTNAEAQLRKQISWLETAKGGN